MIWYFTTESIQVNNFVDASLQPLLAKKYDDLWNNPNKIETKLIPHYERMITCGMASWIIPLGSGKPPQFWSLRLDNWVQLDWGTS